MVIALRNTDYYSNAVACSLIGWMRHVDSRGKRSSTLAEFAQLPTTKLSATQPPCCFDDILEQGMPTAADASPHTCTLYACHLDPEVCQQQRMRGPHFLYDTDSVM